MPQGLRIPLQTGIVFPSGVTSLEQGWRLRDMLPEPTRFDMISGAGLFVHEEKPAAWVSAVNSFLQYTSGD